MTLPDCKHRHQTEGREYFCTHPKVYTVGYLVTANQCANCISRLYDRPPRGADVPSPAAPNPARPDQPVRVGQCVHQGPEVRRVGCHTCLGNVQIRVLQCSVHTECTIAKDVGVQVCQLCDDWQPAAG